MAIVDNYRHVFLACVQRINQIPITNYFGPNSHLKGVMADIDNVIVHHNSDAVTADIYHWFDELYQRHISYCLSTWNCHRLHTVEVAKNLPGKPFVVYNDIFCFPFHNPYRRASYELGIQPSQLLVVDDYFTSSLYAQRNGCTCVKVKPFETETEAIDSLILRKLRPWDNRLFERHQPPEVTAF